MSYKIKLIMAQIRVSKRLDLKPEVVKILIKEAADAGLKPKGYMENVLENHSKQSKYNQQNG